MEPLLLEPSLVTLKPLQHSQEPLKLFHNSCYCPLFYETSSVDYTLEPYQETLYTPGTSLSTQREVQKNRLTLP